MTADDLTASGWESVVEQAEKKDCFFYSHLFYAKAGEAEGIGEQCRADALKLLGDITSMALKSDKTTEPFRPQITTPKGRSAIPSDFSDEDLAALAALIPEIKDAELKGRIADLLWIRKRDHTMAETAIDCYLVSAKHHEHPTDWLNAFHRIERALRLALQLGKKAGFIEKVAAHIEIVLSTYNGADPLYLSNRLLGLLAEVKIGDPDKHAALAEKLALRAESEGDWQRAMSHWQRKAEWDAISGGIERKKQSEARAAEMYVKLAKASITGTGGYLAASSHLEKAIEAYRRFGGDKDRIEELHRLLLSYQKESIGEMSAFSMPLDINGLVEKARAAVRGKSLTDSLFQLSIMLDPPKKENLRKEIEDSAKQFPLMYLISGVRVNQSGKTIGKRTGLLADTKDDYESALRSHMFSEAVSGHSFYAHSLIEPIRKQINADHSYDINDFIPIVMNNPLIAPGRESIYAQGLMSGLEGDFLQALHLLIPQFENSVRHVLNQQGVITSSLSSDGIQEEFDLNRTLGMNETENVFGSDLLFDLQGLLVEREGSNLRNRLAHGLMSVDEFYSGPPRYFWAIMLRLCCWPAIVRNSAQGIDASKPSGLPQLKQ
jgi:hypothetical protein